MKTRIGQMQPVRRRSNKLKDLLLKLLLVFRRPTIVARWGKLIYQPKKLGLSQSVKPKTQMEEDKVRWTPEQISLLAQCMARFVSISTGQSGAITGRAIDWRRTVAEFRHHSGCNWGYKKLKHKHDNLKLNYRLWLKLKNGETGLGCNSDLETIDAPKEWWDRKILEDKQYGRFQKHGISDELENYLHIVFGNSKARGKMQFSTTGYNPSPGGGGSSSIQASGTQGDGTETPDNSEFKVPLEGGYDMNKNLGALSLDGYNNPDLPSNWLGSSNNRDNPSWKNWVNSSPSSSLGKRCSETSDDTPGNKKTKRVKPVDENTFRLKSIENEMRVSNRQREDLVSYMKGIGSSVSSKAASREEFSMERALARIDEVPNLDRSSALYMYAYSLMCDEARREAFLRARTIEEAWSWVEFQFINGFHGGFGPDLNRKDTNMDSHDVIAERLLNDPNFYFEFVQKIGTFLVMEDDVIASGALLAATIAHLPPPRFRHHSGSYPGLIWVDDLLLAPTDTRIFNAFRMNKFTFIQLCHTLESRYGLSGNEEVTVREKVGLFLHVLAKKQSNRDTQERFSRSSWAVSHFFHEVLNAMDGFGSDIVKPRDPTFAEVSPKITNNPMYLPFENAVGALDGSHVKIVVDEGLQMACRGRKRETTMNVLAICDFDLLFTFVVTGWEGSAHDSYVLNQAKATFNFPKPPAGKYYLADKGYANRGSILTPYSSGRYHSSQWRGQPPQGTEETFNRWHSSLRSVIERAFGVLKNRWHILECVPHFKPMDQNRIVAACFALNNYIRLLDPLDEIFDAYQNHYYDQNGVDPPPQEEVPDGVRAVYENQAEASMDPTRDAIAALFMNFP